MKKFNTLSTLAVIVATMLISSCSMIKPWSLHDKAVVYRSGDMAVSDSIDGHITYQFVPLCYVRKVNDTLYLIRHARFDVAVVFKSVVDTLVDTGHVLSDHNYVATPTREPVAIIKPRSKTTVGLVGMITRDRRVPR